VPGAIRTILWPAFALTDAAFALVRWLV
jgi:hypothetical protein